MRTIVEFEAEQDEALNASLLSLQSDRPGTHGYGLLPERILVKVQDAGDPVRGHPQERPGVL
jgi:hypothetical protein